MKVILSHPTANTNVRAAASALKRSGMLEKFYTAIAVLPDSPLATFGKFPGLSEIAKRSFPQDLKGCIATYPWFELARLLAIKAKFKGLTKHETGVFALDRTYHRFDEHVSRKVKFADAVYAYEDGALASFREAKIHGKISLFEQPIGYWRTMHKILNDEREKRPEWVQTLTGLKDSNAKLFRKDEELALADHIFVASSFTAKTLQEFPTQLENIHLIPYGFPEAIASRKYDTIGKRKLKILFVGGLSQRKGIADLFDAVSMHKHAVELTVVGRKPVSDCDALNASLETVNWIEALPHARILELMRNHDILAFPSLFEGFGLVVAEAMSQGTPVITTDRTCGSDFIIDGQNGWLVPASDPEALALKLDEIASNRSQLAQVGLSARATATTRPWSVYQSELVMELQRIMR